MFTIVCCVFFLSLFFFSFYCVCFVICCRHGEIKFIYCQKLGCPSPLTVVTCKTGRHLQKCRANLFCVFVTNALCTRFFNHLCKCVTVRHLKLFLRYCGLCSSCREMFYVQHTFETFLEMFRVTCQHLASQSGVPKCELFSSCFA